MVAPTFIRCCATIDQPRSATATTTIPCSASSERRKRSSAVQTRTRKTTVAAWIRPLRRPKYLPRIRSGDHSCVQAFHATPLTEASRLKPRKKPKKTGVLAAGSSRGRNGRATPRPSQPAALAHAADQVMCLGRKMVRHSGRQEDLEEIAPEGQGYDQPVGRLGEVEDTPSAAPRR